MAKEIFMVILKGTREAVIGKLSEKSSDTGVILESPRIVILQKDADGQVGIQFVPYPFPLADYFLEGDWDGEMEVSSDDIIIEYNESKILHAVVKSYLEATSKLTIPETAGGHNVVSLK